MDHKTQEQSRLVVPAALLSAALGILVAPTGSTASPLGATSACADGTCCLMINSMCVVNETAYYDYYYISSGQCQ
jgi:hypothetical protein